MDLFVISGSYNPNYQKKKSDSMLKKMSLATVTKYLRKCCQYFYSLYNVHAELVTHARTHARTTSYIIILAIIQNKIK